jgi:DNA-binding NarL/FixJ family response regulator
MMELLDPGRGPEKDAEIKTDNEKLERALAIHSRDFDRREKTLLMLYLQGLGNEQIARIWNENVKVIRVDMNAMLAKLRYRVKGK